METNGKKIKVGLVQINNGFSGQNYLPYSVGVLQAYAQHHLRNPSHYEFLTPIYRRVKIAEAVEQLSSADVIGFSTYVWNVRISLEVARRVKEQWPEKLIVFGGPQVPDRCDDFMAQNDFVDIACHGEGERVFLAVLENLKRDRWPNIPSITFRESDGALAHTEPGERIKDLSTIPSPYLGGVFIPLMAANPQERWIALWETNRGCPFSCTFCDWGSAVAGKVYKIEMERLLDEIEWFADRRIEYVFCTDANFGILPRDIDLAKHVAKIKSDRGFPHALSVQNTKNATERAYTAQKILAEAGLNKGVALSMQATDPETLKAIKRDNISLDTYAELQRRFTRDKVETYSDLILALPGQSYDSFVDGVAQLIEGGQHNRIQFNNLSILPNAEMGDPDYQKRYGMETVVSKIINIHGSLEDEEIYEEQQLVIATSAMPREDWVRTRAFCWMTAFLYFDKILQIPLTVVRECCGAEYRDLLELFTEHDISSLPILTRCRDFFQSEAEKIQNGGPEYVHSEDWLNIWWPADEYALIQLCAANQLDAFYAECEELLSRFLKEEFLELPAELLHDAIRLNAGLMKRPFQTDDLDIELSLNIWEFYQAVLAGQNLPLECRPSKHHIDRTSVRWQTWEDWCREVVWYGNKKGAYLYSSRLAEPQLAGHY
jgi:radical SAM superfamily enzyme YgiQ (UPF0313 family)